MKKLVTGATGLVGSHLLSDLVKRGEKVRALKRDKSDISFVKHLLGDSENNVEWIEGDVLDIASLETAMDGVDEVYHCAAVVSFHPEDASSLMKINVGGTVNVVNVCLEKKIKKLCYVSSTAAIGKTKNGDLITEKNKWREGRTESKYSLSKHLSEVEVWRGIEEGLNAVIVNPCIIVGPGQWGKSSTDIFPKVWEGNLKFFTGGGNAFVDVRDVSKAMIALMKSEIHSERFLIVSENLPFKIFFEMVADNLGKPKANIRVNPVLSEIGWRLDKMRSRLTGKKPLITKETARAANETRCYSNEKIKKAIGIDFIPVAKSVKETGDVFLKQVKQQHFLKN